MSRCRWASGRDKALSPALALMAGLRGPGATGRGDGCLPSPLPRTPPRSPDREEADTSRACDWDLPNSARSGVRPPAADPGTRPSQVPLPSARFRLGCQAAAASPLGGPEGAAAQRPPSGGGVALAAWTRGHTRAAASSRTARRRRPRTGGGGEPGALPRGDSWVRGGLHPRDLCGFGSGIPVVKNGRCVSPWDRWSSEQSMTRRVSGNPELTPVGPRVSAAGPQAVRPCAERPPGRRCPPVHAQGCDRKSRCKDLGLWSFCIWKQTDSTSDHRAMGGSGQGRGGGEEVGMQLPKTQFPHSALRRGGATRRAPGTQPPRGLADPQGGRRTGPHPRRSISRRRP